MEQNRKAGQNPPRVVAPTEEEEEEEWRMEEAPENGKESPHSAHVSGMNEWMSSCLLLSIEIRRGSHTKGRAWIAI